LIPSPECLRAVSADNPSEQQISAAETSDKFQGCNSISMPQTMAIFKAEAPIWRVAYEAEKP